MASIGSFGKKHEPVVDEDPDTFGWFGSDVRLRTEFNQVRLINLMDLVRSVEDTDPAATAVIKDMFELIIEPDDFKRFWKDAEDNWQTQADMIELSTILMEAITSRPTRRLSDSSNGQPSTPENSPAASSSATASAGSEEPAHRPDLVLLQQGGRETREYLQAKAREAVGV
jgi:hypothetical protein